MTTPNQPHTAQKWYTECDCVHPDDDPATENVPDEQYQRLVDEFDEAHTDLYDGDDYFGKGCEKSYTDTRCQTCSVGGDYPDVPWPCRHATDQEVRR